MILTSLQTCPLLLTFWMTLMILPDWFTDVFFSCWFSGGFVCWLLADTYWLADALRLSDCCWSLTCQHSLTFADLLILPDLLSFTESWWLADWLPCSCLFTFYLLSLSDLLYLQILPTFADYWFFLTFRFSASELLTITDPSKLAHSTWLPDVDWLALACLWALFSFRCVCLHARLLARLLSGNFKRLKRKNFNEALWKVSCWFKGQKESLLFVSNQSSGAAADQRGAIPVDSNSFVHCFSLIF